MSIQKKTSLILLAAAAFGLAGCNNGDSGSIGPAPAPGPQTSNSFGVTSANRLIGFDLITPNTINSSLALTGLAAGETVRGVAFRPADGLLYALISSASAARVASINTDTGAVAAGAVLINDPSNAVAFAGLSGASFGTDFNPVPDRLRVVSNTGQDLRINVTSGATIVDGALNGAATGATGAAYTNAFSLACRTALNVIDPATDRLYLQNPPNNGTLTSIGALGLDVTAVNGFDIQTDTNGANFAYAALSTVAGSPAVTTTALYSINLTTGAATRTLAFPLNAGESLSGFATRPLPVTFVVTQAAGELVGLTTSNGVVTFLRGSPAKLCTSVAAATGLPAGTNLLSLTTRPATGTLIGLGSNGSLYNVTTAGAATSLCTLAADPTDATLPFGTLDNTASTRYGTGFNPVPDRLRVVSNTGVNLRINTTPNASGQCLVITDTNLSGGTPSVTAVGYTNTVPSAGVTTLFGLDTGSDSLIRIGADPANGIAGDPGNPNSGVVANVGTLGVTGDVNANAGFTIDGRLNTAFAALQAGAATTSTLYTVNLATGAATSVGVVGTGTTAPLRALALTGGVATRVYGLTFDGRLVAFGYSAATNALTPNTLVVDVAITGVAAGESLVGVDFRPANTTLYGLSTLGRVYTINTTTGAATLASTLAADPTDLTAPFSALTAGATYGLDFNPVADRMRVVDSAGNDLRINVATGATITDGNLTGNTGPVWAAGYTNSFAGATATTLYDLDATTLYTQNPPNNGTLVPVGPLGVTGLGDIGLDISGGANGIVLAAIRTAAGAGPSDLYRVNLATGAATLISATAGASTIGTAATQQIRSLAVDIR